MLPSEMAILMAIALSKDSDKKLLTHSNVLGEYIVHMYDSLVERGYLERNNPGGYQLTWEGMAVLVEFLLQQNRERIKDTVQALQKMGIRRSQAIDILEEEVGKVR